MYFKIICDNAYNKGFGLFTVTNKSTFNLYMNIYEFTNNTQICKIS